MTIISHIFIKHNLKVSIFSEQPHQKNSVLFEVKENKTAFFIPPTALTLSKVPK